MSVKSEPALPESTEPEALDKSRPTSAWSSTSRTSAIVAGLLLVALLVVAASLQPDARGMGTHRQLGLPPCTFTMFFNMRCPTCGMTTSWAHFVRGQWLASLQANTGGWLLALMATFAAPWLISSGIRGRPFGGPLGEKPLFCGVGIVILVTLADWTYRLTR